MAFLIGLTHTRQSNSLRLAELKAWSVLRGGGAGVALAASSLSPKNLDGARSEVDLSPFFAVTGYFELRDGA
jgi:hypothetical protein